MKVDIPDGCLKEIKKIQIKSNLELNNKKHLIAVAIHRLFIDSEGTKSDHFIAEVVSDIYELQEKGILGKQLRKMPSEDEEN